MPSDMDPGKLLIVDDEINIRNGLRAVLIKDGHKVQDVGSAEEALPVLETFPCEVAIVDIRMPGLSGIELLHEIRTRWPYVSVIVLTGHGTLDTAMKAVKEGAQDYLLKPARPDTIRQTVSTALAVARRRREQAELMHVLRSGLQRLGEYPTSSSLIAEATPKTDMITVGDLQIDLRAHEARRDGVPIALSPSEYQLLVVMATRAGQVVDYVTLVQLSLGYTAEPWEAKELIKRHVFSLRQKVEPEPSSPRYILNVRGVGYRLASP